MRNQYGIFSLQSPLDTVTQCALLGWAQLIVFCFVQVVLNLLGNAFDAVWFNDGQSLVYARTTQRFGRADIWYATRREDGVFEQKEFLSTPAAEAIPTPSPDGRYLAVDYHGEIFIVPTDPEVGEKKQVTASGWRQRTC